MSLDQAELVGGDRNVPEKLLDAAEGLFCERGFEATSVRDIAAAAGCNIASINYYFGGKDNLYTEVWRRHLGLMRKARIASIDRVMSQGGKPMLEDLLRSYATAFVEPLVDKKRGASFMRMMIRETIDRHLPEDLFINEMIVPVMAVLLDALAKICPDLRPDDARLAILSIVGQLMHVVGAKTMFEQAVPAAIPKVDLNEIIEHVVKFSAGGIRACAAANRCG